MKILHVCPYFAPAWAYGGTPKAVYELAKAQAKLGHTVTVLTTDACDQKRSSRPKKKISGIRIVRLRNFSNSLAWKFHFVSPYAFWQIPNPKDFDIVHFHELRSTLHILCLLRLSSNKPIYISPWGTLGFNQRFSGLKSIFDFGLKALLHRHSVYFLTQTSHEKKIAKSYHFQATITVIPLGMNPDEFDHLQSKQAARKFFGYRNDEFVLVFLGRISQVKGISLLLRSFSHVQKKFPQIRLLIVGREDGYLARAMQLTQELALKKFVHFYPALYEKKRFLAYRAADIFITLPTVYEETATTCLEALYCQRPVITTHFASIPFLQATDGVLHCIAEERAVVRAMQKAITQPIKVKRSTIKKYFSWETIAKETLQLYAHN